MILSDGAIRRALVQGGLAVDGVSDPEGQFGPASVDLCLGATFLRYRAGVKVCRMEDNPADLMETLVVAPGEVLTLWPHEFVLGHTVERVRIPPHLVGQLGGRSSVARRGIEVHMTAGYCDPGFEGQITLEIANQAPVAVELRPGMRVAQLVLEALDAPALRPYRGKYQGAAGVVASRLHLDRAEARR